MDWEEKVDPKGTTYYVNHATQATQWDRPVEVRKLKYSKLPLQELVIRCGFYKHFP